MQPGSVEWVVSDTNLNFQASDPLPDIHIASVLVMLGSQWLSEIISQLFSVSFGPNSVQRKRGAISPLTQRSNCIVARKYTMSKYTRLNKINHYHDSSSKSSNQIEFENSSLKFKSPLRISKQINTSPSITSLIHQTDTGALTINNSSKSKMSRRSSMIAPNDYNLKLAFFAIISMLLILLVCINGVQSLNCYHCSSVDNPDCDEAFTGKANITETDCEKQIGRPAKVCRKIVQYIEEKKVVIRSCGYIDEHDEKDRKTMCYKRSGTFAIMMESCNCYTDNCNHSSSLVPHQSVLILASSFSVLLVLYCAFNQKQLDGAGQESSRKR